MSLDLKVIAIVCGVFFAAGFYAAKQFNKPTVVTQYKDRDVVHTNIVTKVRIVKQKDGTTVEEKEIVDNSEHERQIEHIESKTLQRDWMVSALYGAPYNALNERIWGLSVQRRVLGPVLVGIQYNSNKSVLGVVSLEF